MAQRSSPNQNVDRIESQTTTLQPSPTQITQPSTQPTQTDIVRQKLTEVLGEIIGKAQEVGFELATLECAQSNTCPLVKKSKELIRTLKKLFELRGELEKLSR